MHLCVLFAYMYNPYSYLYIRHIRTHTNMWPIDIHAYVYRYMYHLSIYLHVYKYVNTHMAWPIYIFVYMEINVCRPYKYVYKYLRKYTLGLYQVPHTCKDSHSLHICVSK